jgi:hypothetical protein
MFTMISFGVLELLMRSRTLNLNCAAVNSGKNEKPPDGGDGQPGADEQGAPAFPANCWNSIGLWSNHSIGLNWY